MYRKFLLEEKKKGWNICEFWNCKKKQKKNLKIIDLLIFSGNLQLLLSSLRWGCICFNKLAQYLETPSSPCPFSLSRYPFWWRSRSLRTSRTNLFSVPHTRWVLGGEEPAQLCSCSGPIEHWSLSAASEPFPPNNCNLRPLGFVF